MRIFKHYFICLMVACAFNGYAQTIRVIDADGDPVPYATVTTMQGKLVGTTDINGVLRILRKTRSCACHKWLISHSR